jgi:hypothetical protein
VCSDHHTCDGQNSLGKSIANAMFLAQIGLIPKNPFRRYRGDSKAGEPWVWGLKVNLLSKATPRSLICAFGLIMYSSQSKNLVHLSD